MEGNVGRPSDVSDIRPFRVLIVEDSLFFRGVFKEVLSTQFPSLKIREASDGEEALQEIEAQIPDLIFMDIRLPRGNGLDLTRKIKAQYPGTLIVVFTSYDTIEYREAARKHADYFLSKGSATRVHLFSLIQSILSTKASPRSCRQ